EKRPTADEILKILAFWKDAIDFYKSNWPNYSGEQLDELKEMRKIFEEADKNPFNPSTITATVHPNAVYTSRLLNFPNHPRPVNSNIVAIISINNGSNSIIDLKVTIDININININIIFIFIIIFINFNQTNWNSNNNGNYNQ